MGHQQMHEEIKRKFPHLITSSLHSLFIQQVSERLFTVPSFRGTKTNLTTFKFWIHRATAGVFSKTFKIIFVNFFLILSQRSKYYGLGSSLDECFKSWCSCANTTYINKETYWQSRDAERTHLPSLPHCMGHHHGHLHEQPHFRSSYSCAFVHLGTDLGVGFLSIQWLLELPAKPFYIHLPNSPNT